MGDDFFVHEKAIVEHGATIGKGTHVWAFAHVLPGAVIGEDCNICDGVFIEGNTVIGNRVTIKCGVQIWEGVILEDDVFVGPNATFTNDPFPRSEEYPAQYSRTIIRAGASIGANATILPGLTIGQNSIIGAGSVVTRNVPSNAIVRGNPARITGYVDSERKKVLAGHTVSSPTSLRVKRVKLIELPLITDLRGSLSYGEYDQHLPFSPKRYFLQFGVPSVEVRGEHAHRELDQFLVCVHGSLAVVLDDGIHREEVVLNRPNLGLHIPPLIWATQYKYTPDAVLLVLASDVYRAEDYIRDYDEFLSLVKYSG